MTRILLIAALFTLGTTATSMAMGGCSHQKEQQTSSCAEGSTWDAESASCVPIAAS